MNMNMGRQPNGAQMQYKYTHQLHFSTRQRLCQILDADQSWNKLAQDFMGLDASQLSLLGQAYLRNGSPTDELLSRLDSSNAKLADICAFLRQINHSRALEVLEPFAGTQVAMPASSSGGLNTPTPSIGNLDDCWPPQHNTNSISYRAREHDMLATIADQFELEPRQIAPEIELELQQQQMGGAGVHQMAMGQQQQSNPNNAILSRLSRLQLQPAAPAGHNNNPNPSNTTDAQLRPNHGNTSVSRQRASISNPDVRHQLELIKQPYSELKQASNNFGPENIIGNGGFASVYWGHWKGNDVAIKRLKCNLIDQALNELIILNSYRIDNILPIYAISVDGPEACLVYQFMANGSLEDRLACKNQTAPLTWRQRAQIGEGVAKALFYLHTLTDKPLVHCDVKSANVLLDAQFVPKLGDFGLARHMFDTNPLGNEQRDSTHCTVTSVHGTRVYLPFEYLRYKSLSPAVDVYSYGIVMLEMGTGKKAYDGKQLLVDYVEEQIHKHHASSDVATLMASLKDARAGVADDEAELGTAIWHKLLINLGLECSDRIKKKRPNMGQVLERFSQFWAKTEHQQLQRNDGSGAATPISRSTALGSNMAAAAANSGRAVSPRHVKTSAQSNQLKMSDTHARLSNRPGLHWPHEINDINQNQNQHQVHQQHQVQDLMSFEDIPDQSFVNPHQQQQQQYMYQIQDQQQQQFQDAQRDNQMQDQRSSLPIITELGVEDKSS